MLQVDVSLVLESSRLDLGSHCTLCKSEQHHHLWTKRPFAPTSSSTVLVFFVEKSFFKFSRANWLKWQGMWAALSKFIIHHCSNPHFLRSDFQMTQRKWVEKLTRSSFANPIKEIEGQGKKEWISIWFLLLLLLLYAFLVFRLPLALKR